MDIPKEKIYLAKAEDMRAMDKTAVEELGISSTELMNNASTAFFNALVSDGIAKDTKNILILCGAGNNGGDGFLVSLLLADAGFNVTVFKTFTGEPKSADAQYYYLKSLSDKRVNITEKIQELEVYLKKSHIVIDAVFGTGFKGSFNSDAARAFELVNILCGGNEADTKKVALDVPSGIDCDDGSVCENAFKADLTITFEFLKTGMVSFPAAEYCGKIKVANIGFPKTTRNHLTKSENPAIFLTADILTSNIKERQRNTHKGTYGKLLAACGSDTMTGAAYFASIGALRCGVGLLYLACPQSILRVMQIKLNEPVFIPYDTNKDHGFEEAVGDINRFNAVLFGCGSGMSKTTSTTLDFLIKNVSNTLILDADGINALSENINILEEKKCALAITPHPLEMARLIGKDVNYVQANRISTAKNFAKKHNCCVVLKGAATVIANFDGKLAINSSGNAGLAKGGSGDILAGMIASYAAQGYDIFTASCMAVYLHGLAADLCAAETSQSALLPSDLESYITKAGRVYGG